MSTEQKHYFTLLVEECNELTRIAQEYLDSLEFIDNETMAKEIWEWAASQMKTNERGYFIFDGENELAGNIVDAGVPYFFEPTNGSLHYLLGFSPTARDANLRTLYEYVKGNREDYGTFKMLAD